MNFNLKLLCDPLLSIKKNFKNFMQSAISLIYKLYSTIILHFVDILKLLRRWRILYFSIFFLFSNFAKFHQDTEYSIEVNQIL